MRQHPRDLSVEQLDSLLSRGRLSGPQQDRILEAVLRQTQNPLWFLHRLGEVAQGHRWIVAASAAAMVTLFALVFSHQTLEPQATGEWGVRGANGEIHEPQVEASCVGVCRPGSLLVLRVQDVPEAVFVAAYAVGHTGQRIWYFPTDAGAMPRVQPKQTTPLRQGIHLGPEHMSGAYEVHMVFLRKPLSRDAIVQLDATPRPEVVVGQTTRKFEIVP